LKNKQLYAVFEVIGLSGDYQSFWISTAILPSGFPMPMEPNAHTARCTVMPTAES